MSEKKVLTATEINGIKEFLKLNVAHAESNCIYVLPSNYLKVIQVVEKGILLSQTHPNQYTLNKVIFVNTKKQYVDDELVQSIYVKSAGVMTYNSVIGVSKTVHAFQDLN